MPQRLSFPLLVRALRLPFVTASALPFIFGSLFAPGALQQSIFWLGLVAVITAHLGANLINDYADSKSGADWHDKQSYNFFGGSKLIQEGTLSEGFYYGLAAFFSLVALLAVLVIANSLQSPFVIWCALGIVLASWAYSMKPLQLSYHRLGEIAIFVLFGPAVVMGGYYLQTGIFPDLASFLVSLPFGFLTAAILYANEVPDYDTDRAANKHNLANALPRERAYIGYLILSLASLIVIVKLVWVGYLSPWALVSLLALVPIIKAASVLKKYSSDKLRLIESSKLAIVTHTLVSLVLIGAVLF